MNRHPIVASPLLHWLITGLALGFWAVAAVAADERLVFSGKTFPWLQAVGKLQVPGQRYKDGHSSHYLEDCSATLVSLPGRLEADIIVTAWHCLELYQDLSKPISLHRRNRLWEPADPAGTTPRRRRWDAR